MSNWRASGESESSCVCGRSVPYSREPLTYSSVSRALSAEGRRPAYVASSQDIERLLEAPGMADEAGYPLAHVVPQCLLSPAYFILGTRPRWAQQRRLDALLQAAVEGGIVGKINRDELWEMRLVGELARGPAVPPSNPSAAPADKPRPLTLTALTEPAVLLCAGKLAAAVAFLRENVQRCVTHDLCNA
ncbi:hypothetical protein R5R35_004683 [Gryllus longicercus]|uniref:Uncharacterized protein n=1 Tax=Gryllus longicercus TaxID=2509291 RepID=A0AAN9WEJ9_9ORTH